MNLLHVIANELTQKYPHLGFVEEPDYIRLIFANPTCRILIPGVGIRCEGDRIIFARHGEGILSYWKPVDVSMASVNLFDKDFVSRMHNIINHMFNIIPAIQEVLRANHATVYWRQISPHCIQTTSEPEVTITYEQENNTIVVSTCYVYETPFASYDSSTVSMTIDLLHPDFLSLILAAFKHQRGIEQEGKAC